MTEQPGANFELAPQVESNGVDFACIKEETEGRVILISSSNHNHNYIEEKKRRKRKQTVERNFTRSLEGTLENKINQDLLLVRGSHFALFAKICKS